MSIDVMKCLKCEGIVNALDIKDGRWCPSCDECDSIVDIDHNKQDWGGVDYD